MLLLRVFLAMAIVLCTWNTMPLVFWVVHRTAYAVRVHADWRKEW
jgi:hypothetical protein